MAKMKISERIQKQWQCQLCGVSPYRKGEEKTKLVIDHDHNIFPPRARGKLCYRCNLGVSFLETWLDRNMLDIAMGYVQTHGYEKISFKDWYLSEEVYRYVDDSQVSGVQ